MNKSQDERLHLHQSDIVRICIRTNVVSNFNYMRKISIFNRNLTGVFKSYLSTGGVCSKSPTLSLIKLIFIFPIISTLIIYHNYTYFLYYNSYAFSLIKSKFHIIIFSIFNIILFTFKTITFPIHFNLHTFFSSLKSSLFPLFSFKLTSLL